MNDAEIFDFNFRTQLTKVRGAYLDMCADLEFMLVDITCMCLLSKEKERNHVKEILVNSSMLSNKIKFAKKALSVYNEEYGVEFAECFKQFNSLKDWRNKFSHSRIEGDKNKQDLDVFIFVNYRDGELDEDIQSKALILSKLPTYASFIFKMGSELIPKLYYERHVTRYNNTIQFPSNRSMSYWHRYFENKEK